MNRRFFLQLAIPAIVASTSIMPVRNIARLLLPPPSIRLVRDNDLAEQDFYKLGNGGLDAEAINIFAGGSNLCVVAIYDQMIGRRDLVAQLTKSGVYERSYWGF